MSRTRSSLALVALLAVLMLLSVAMPVAAQNGTGRNFSDASAEATLVVSPDINVAAARRAGGNISVIVKLASAPTYRDFAVAGGRNNRGVATNAIQSRAAQINAEQESFAAAATALGGRVTNRFTFLLNAVVVEIAPERVISLARIPGVVAIGPNRTYAREHTTSMPLIRASDVWNGAYTGGSFTGEGVTVAVIDEGIDYTHAHFGGQENYDDSDPTVLGETGMEYYPPSVLPNTATRQMKVIGGRDFVGDDYDAAGSGAQLIPVPDPDPIGCDYSHGTHVAGTIAGYGVDETGATFTGDYTDGDALFPSYPLSSLGDFLIGPGAAPESYLVSLRVFGCSGSVNTDILLASFEEAATETYLGEDVDVVNMSLGSPYGGTGPDDFMNGAQEALADLGIVVVASAGNNGDFYLVSGAPGSAKTTISVANIVDSAAVIEGSFTYGVVTIPAAKGAMYADAMTDPLTADVVEGLDAANASGPTTKDGCTAYTNAAAVAGKWAIVDRGTCSFSVKSNMAKLAGAAGVIIANNSAAAPFGPGQTAGVDDALPTVMVGQADGVALRVAIGLGTVSGTFDGSVIQTVSDITFVPETTTSRGGAMRGNNDMILKPNIAGPGSSITSAGAGTNDGLYTISGTSMSSPHIAGGAALLIEAFGAPVDGAGVSLLKQRLMNTATIDLYNSVASPTPFHSPQRVGAGFADFVAAINTNLVAYATESPENTSLSFGYPRALVGTTPSVTKTITVQNLSGSTMTLATGYTARSDWGGAVVSVSPAFVTIAGGGSSTVNVTLTLVATQANLNVGGDPLFATAGKGILHEESGYVTLTPTSGSQTAIRVPVYAAPHITSDIWADDNVSISGDTGSSYVLLSGDGFDFGPDANDHLSVTSAYTLIAEDGEETDLFWDVDGSGGAPDPDEELIDYSYADVEYVGANLRVDGANTFLDVGIKTYGEWNTPRDLFVEVYLDLDDDGTDDYIWYYGSGVLDTYNLSFVELISEDAFSFGSTTAVNHLSGASLDTMLLKNNVMVFPTIVNNTSLAGLGGAVYTGGPIRVTVATLQRDSDYDVTIDEVVASYTPSITFAPTFFRNLYPALDGSPIDFTYDVTGLATLPEIMTIHHQNNDPDSRVQITTLSQITGTTFNLVSPADDALVRDAADLTEATWTELTGASVYTLTITQISSNTGFEPRASGDQIVITGTSAADADLITCTAGTCAADLSVYTLEDGVYSWSVVAGEDPNEVEASNNAYMFVVETDGLTGSLLLNGGFETAGATANKAENWTGTGVRKTVGTPQEGTAFLQVPDNKQAKQTLTVLNQPELALLLAGDTLDLDFYTKQGKGKLAILTITYADTTIEKCAIPTVVNTAPGNDWEAEGFDTCELNGPVTQIVLNLKHSGGTQTTATSYDNVTLMVVQATRNGALSLPAAPDGFRGNN